ncbi:MAG: hypothetical protein JWN69_1005 [Alphaproteobacteria bacterium]|nr:hypothetical protein [Alphaproteobacteria bacterium]
MESTGQSISDRDPGAPRRSLRVACKSPGVPEIFRSIQGEGRHVGRLRTFLRLSGCNLQCSWCDTPYTWNWEGTYWPDIDGAPDPLPKFRQDNEMVVLTVDDIAARVLALPAEGLVITGGEPLVQKRGLLALISRLSAARQELLIEIETNGTIAPSADLAAAVDLFMVSPKLDHARNRSDSAIRADAMTSFASMPNAMFKFVAGCEADVVEAAELARRFGIAASRVYVMPLGTDSAAIVRTGASLIGAVTAHGFSYSDRLHIHLFGEKRAT